MEVRLHRGYFFLFSMDGEKFSLPVVFLFGNLIMKVLEAQRMMMEKIFFLNKKLSSQNSLFSEMGMKREN